MPTSAMLQARFDEKAAPDTAGPVAIPLGDPAPWFSATCLNQGMFNLQVAAGRWIVLSFFDQPKVDVLDEFTRDLQFDDDHAIFCGVLAAPPHDPDAMIGRSTQSIQFIADYDGAVAGLFGVKGPRTFVLDAMLRVIASIPGDEARTHFKAVAEIVRGLPRIDDSAGMPLTAPVLIVPRVFDFPLCDMLVRVFDELGGAESGFLMDVNGQTSRVIDHRLKRRTDLVIVHPVLREAMRSQIVRRLVPAIDRFFQFKATRIDRYIVSCYDSAVGGYFGRHRDNENIGGQHRRFAVTINLNRDYDGGDLMFPEFGRRTYRAPVGGAIVFSCGALHQVTPVTNGRRYAFPGFLYSEADARLREANNARLSVGAAPYVPGPDLLFPNASSP